MKRSLPAANRPRAKELIGETRRARGLSVEELAAMVGTKPKSLEEYERPGGPTPGRPLFADLALALESAAMLTLMLPDSWIVLSPEHVEQVREALVAAGILPPG